MIYTQMCGFFQTCLPDQAMVKTAFESEKNNGQEFIFSFERAEGLEI